MLEQKKKQAGGPADQNACQGGVNQTTAHRGDSGGDVEEVDRANLISDVLGGMGDIQVTGEKQNPLVPENAQHNGSVTPLDTCKALAAGDEKGSETILRLVADLYPPPKTAKLAQPAPKTVITALETATTTELTKPAKATAHRFVAGVKSSHGFCGLPAFYNKNLRALKGSVPLTIFNPKWQQQVAAHSAKRRQIDRGGAEERRYTGHPAPDEWSQTYAQWSRNYQCFIKTLQTALVAQREDINPWTGNKKPNHNKRQNNNNNNANNKPGDNRNPNNHGQQQQNQQDNNRRYEPYALSTERQRSGKYEERAQDRSKGYRSQDQGYQNQSGKRRTFR
ncbi:hypothetical protein PCANC_28427 [Puccinia coronata f. sp. avenae]|nr:hypothetical protein PCANC_28427 [Puccinia coronata f. sp. avenae]